ncbi:MAG: DNA repair protein RadA [Eubacteriales bacterium]
MKTTKSYFECTECGYRTPKWMGKCPSCGKFSTMEEVSRQEEVPETGRSSARSGITFGNKAVAFENMEMPAYIRTQTGMAELDRVLGGGIVDGSVVLLAGEPGIGKSTLLLQICESLSYENRVLYVSGEESGGQLKYRAERLKITGKNLYLLTETDVDQILSEIEEVRPSFVIIDSIQTMYCPGVPSSAGSVSQIKESTMRYISLAKSKGISILIVGHVTKEGSIAGPKVLEHMVDAVLSFEGDRQHIFRIIRAVKNRYGSTNEIGVFEMTEGGLEEVQNPSEMLLSGRPKNSSGNCAVCTIEGSRPMVTEIQALVAATSFPVPRRTADGVDYNRVCLILAILEKRMGLRFNVNDVYMNVIGGFRLEENAADLAIALALISSFKDLPLPDDLIAFGELGLSGECRSVSSVDLRVAEAVKLGFCEIVLPKRNYEKLKDRKFPEGVHLRPVSSLYDAVRILAKS